MSKYAVEVDGVSLRFPMLKHRPRRIKEAVLDGVRWRSPEGQSEFWALQDLSLIHI